MGHSVNTWADDVTRRVTCRACDSDKLVQYLDLGVQPLANAFLHREDLTLPEFEAPLRVQFCKRCGLSQLTHTVAPERLYLHYLYCSGVSQSWRDHCDRLAAEMMFLLPPKPFVVDIASNDGSLLRPFKERGCHVLGVEPAQNLAQTVYVPTIPVFWSADTAQRVKDTHGPADLITATNVFGHVDDVHDFLRGIKLALAKDGIAIIECPHIFPLLWMNAFDTIYHEHLSYWALSPLKWVANMVGLTVYDVRPQHIHGGTMRYYLCHSGRRAERSTVTDLVNREFEEQLADPSVYDTFRTNVFQLVTALKRELEAQDLFGYGASAKGNTLLNTTHASLAAIFEDGPAKQGLFTPGRHIPVGAPKDLSTVPKLLLLSWNWAVELKQKAKARGFRGEFLVPIPKPTWSR